MSVYKVIVEITAPDRTSLVSNLAAIYHLIQAGVDIGSGQDESGVDCASFAYQVERKDIEGGPSDGAIDRGVEKCGGCKKEGKS